MRYSLFRSSRGRQVVEDVLGEEFEGELVSAAPTYVCHGAAPEMLDPPRSRPGAGSSLRDIHQLKERFPEHEGLAQWSQKVREVYLPRPSLPGTRDCRKRCGSPGR